MQNKINFFFFGIAIALGALLIELVLASFFPEEFRALYSQLTFLLVFFIATEEFLKFAAIRKTTTFFKNLGDFFLSSFLTGSGFALVEIFLAFSGNEAGGNGRWIFFLGIFAVHVSTSLFFGAGFFLKTRGQRFAVPASILAAMAFHLAYNLLIIKNASFSATALYIFFLLLLPLLTFKMLASKPRVP